MGRVRAGDGAGEVVPGCAHRISPSTPRRRAPRRTRRRLARGRTVLDGILAFDIPKPREAERGEQRIDEVSLGVGLGEPCARALMERLPQMIEHPANTILRLIPRTHRPP